MPQAVVEIVASPSRFETLPLLVAQRSSRASALIMLMLLVPAFLLVLVPSMLLMVSAAAAYGIATDNPGAAAQALAGLAAATALFGVPLNRIVRAFGAARIIEIAPNLVTVTDSGLFGPQVWQTTLREFRGVAHHVRSTLSGVRHELILVHPERRRSLLLHAESRIPRDTLEQVARLLRLPEIQPVELYRPRLSWRAAQATPPPALQVPAI